MKEHQYRIQLVSCHDTTEFVIYLHDEEQVLVLKTLRLLSRRTSQHECQPVLTYEELSQAQDETQEKAECHNQDEITSIISVSCTDIS